MSATDQAFIRAYDSELPTTAKPPRPIHDMLAAHAAASQPQSATITQNASQSAGVYAPLHAGQASSIHVGIEHFVPPPHAKFGSVSTTGVLPLASSAIDAPLAGGNLLLLRTPFSQTTKAALSSFTTKLRSPSEDEPLAKPALEVDSIRWPAICSAIQNRSAAAIESLCAQLIADAESGTQVIAISGIERGEGRSTLTLCLARQFGEAKKVVALVDADFSNPGLIQQVGVQVDRGWETVLRGEKQLWDVTIESLADRMALVPLAPEAISDGLPDVHRLSAMFAELARHYDFVLIDAGPLESESATPQWLLDPSCGVQGVALVHDVRRQNAGRLAAVCLQLAEAKQRQLGIAEMFVGAEHAVAGVKPAMGSPGRTP